MADFRAVLAACGVLTFSVSGGMARAEDAPLIASGLKLSADEKHFKLEMDLDRAPQFTFHYVDQPPRLIVDLPRTAFTLPEKAVKGQGLVKSVRYGTMGEGQARMVVTLDKPVKLQKSEAVPAGQGSVLVFEGDKVSQGDFAKLVTSQDWSSPPSTTSSTDAVPESAATPDPGQPFLVAVDAGHGGIDTGATSSDGKVIEKDVTLAFAKKVAAAINATPGMQAFLTREDDRFLSLSERVEVARGRKANLFVSLHADKLKQDDIRGATVYTISDKASDSLSASVAERENLSDEIAGIKSTEEPSEVADILLDLTRRETQAFSVTLAQSVIESFDGEVELINNPHRSAGFWVLRAPEIPSILLELGFLSNKKDQSLLIDDAWRNKIAGLLTQAIVHYHQPQATTPIANGN